MNTKAVFRTLNGVCLSLTLFLATGFLLANHRVALAGSSADGLCANEIHDPANPCPAGSVPFIGTMPAWLCRASSPYYTGGLFGLGQQGPYYNCCRYQGTAHACVIQSRYGNTYLPNGGDYYFRSRTIGNMSCNPDSTCHDNDPPPVA